MIGLDWHTCAFRRLERARTKFPPSAEFGETRLGYNIYWKVMESWQKVRKITRVLSLWTLTTVDPCEGCVLLKLSSRCKHFSMIIGPESQRWFCELVISNMSFFHVCLSHSATLVVAERCQRLSCHWSHQSLLLGIPAEAETSHLSQKICQILLDLKLNCSETGGLSFLPTFSWSVLVTVSRRC